VLSGVGSCEAELVEVTSQERLHQRLLFSSVARSVSDCGSFWEMRLCIAFPYYKIEDSNQSEYKKPVVFAAAWRNCRWIIKQ